MLGKARRRLSNKTHFERFLRLAVPCQELTVIFIGAP